MGIGRIDDGCDYVENDSAFRKFMSQIFNDTFMKKYTRFDNWSGFQYSSAVFVNWKAECLVIPRYTFGNFVKESTDFDSWEQMLHKGVEEFHYIQESSI